MKLSPLDIRKHEFARKVRGYDPEEVDAFTEMVSRQWEEVLDELRHARDRVRELEGKIEHYEKVESALHEALTTARSGAKRTQEHAEERARLIIEEAELRAEQILQEADQKQGRLRHEVASLTHRHDEITARLRHFLMSELEILARHEEDRPIGFMQLKPSTPAEALPPVPGARGTTVPAAQITDPAPAAGLPHATESNSVEPEDAAAPADEPRETTYGDIYSRAAEAESHREPKEAEDDEPTDESDDEPAWTLRSIVTGASADDEDDEESDTGEAPASEKERIRRILEDLD